MNTGSPQDARVPTAAPEVSPSGLRGGSFDRDRLSDASRFILRLVAAHEGRLEHEILTTLIAAAGEAIGIHPLIMRDAEKAGDLSDLPDYARRAANRFRLRERSGGP